MIEVLEDARGGVEHIDAAPECGHKQLSRRQRHDARHIVGDERRIVGRIVSYLAYRSVAIVKCIYTGALCPNPHHRIDRIIEECIQFITTQPIGRVCLTFIYGNEASPIEYVETIFGSHPHDTAFVLGDTHHIAVRQAVFEAERTDCSRCRQSGRHMCGQRY